MRYSLPLSKPVADTSHHSWPPGGLNQPVHDLQEGANRRTKDAVRPRAVPFDSWHSEINPTHNQPYIIPDALTQSYDPAGSHVTRGESLTKSPWDLRRKEAKKCLWPGKTLIINVKHAHRSLFLVFLRKSLWFIHHLCFYRSGYAARTFVLLRSADTFISDWWNFIIIVGQKESPPGCTWNSGFRGVRKEQKK